MPREQFIAEMESKLEEFERKLARMAERPKPTEDQARQECERKYHFLRTRRDELRDQLRQAEATSDAGWVTLKLSLERLYDDMVRYMDEAVSKVDGPEDAGVY